MTNASDEAAAALRERYGDDGLVFPAYGDACVADVPHGGLSLLSDDFDDRLPAGALDGLGDVDTVVVALLDGFGYDHWRRLGSELPLIQAMEDVGTVTPLTSIYPSETAAAITTFTTALVPADHGLLGWHQYLESAGISIQTLPFATEDGIPVRDRHPLADPSDLFDGGTLYPEAAEAGIESHVVQPSTVAEGAYSKLTNAGAAVHPGWNQVDMAHDVREVVAGADGPTYVYWYLPEVDTISHRTGPGTPRYDAQVRHLTEAIRTEFVDRHDPGVAEDTALLVTADHGQIGVDPAETGDLDREDVWELLARGDDGEPIPPVGGPRNVQFHTKPGATADLRALLEREFGAVTFTESEYRERGLFGRTPDGTPVDTGPTFERRAPDLVAVHPDRCLWHRADDKLGVHGGLSPEEMIVPLAAARVSDLQG